MVKSIELIYFWSFQVLVDIRTDGAATKVALATVSN